MVVATRRFGLGCFVLLGLAVAAGPSNAAATVESVRLRLSDTDGERVVVSAVYRVRPAGATTLPLLSNPPRGTSVEALTVTLGSVTLEIVDGGVLLPASAAQSDVVELHAGYRVRGGLRTEGNRVRLRLPVVSPAWPPAAAQPETFRAELTLWDPPHTMVRSFPVATVWHDGYRMTLQVVPSQITADILLSEHAPWFTVERAADLATFLVLAVACVAGLLALRRGAA